MTWPEEYPGAQIMGWAIIIADKKRTTMKRKKKGENLLACHVY